MKTERRDLEYYLSLNYKIEIEPITPQEGGGFTARLPQFGSMGIVGDGETTQEALESLEECKRLVFETLLNKGESIPEPENFESYSGRVLVRMPKELHAKLTKDSRSNQTSLNQYIIYLLSSRGGPGLAQSH